MLRTLAATLTASDKQLSIARLYIGPTVFRGKLYQIPRASSRNSVAHRGKIVQIPRLAAASHLSVNWALCCSETSVIEGWRCTKLC